MGISEARNAPRTEDGAPFVSDRELTLGQRAFQRVDNGTEAMNVDGRPAGTPLIVWNGTGASDTGGDWTAGGTGSEQAAADAGSGTNGWDTGVMSANNFTRWNNGSLIDVDGGYDSLQFMLNPQAFPVDSRYRVGFLDASNNIVGNWLRIENYTTNMDLGVWQQVSIPIDDFGLTGNVQKLQMQARITGGQRHYVDDIELVPAGSGGPYRFRVAVPLGERWHLSMLVLILSGASTGWNNNTFANISALDNGLLLRQRRISDSEILWKFNSKDNMDLFGRYHPQDDIEFADGTLLVGFMIKPGKASVIITNDDVLEFVVRDDLSGISGARAFAHFGREVLPT